MVAMKEETKSCDSKDEEIKLGCYGVRHTVALMCFTGYATLTIMRNILNVAIVKMVISYILLNDTVNDIEQLNSTLYTEEDIIAITNQDEVFDWDEKTIGLVLGSFYYGYTIACAVGGRVADYWGARYSFGISVALSSLITLVIPESAKFSPYLLIGVRIIHGCIDGLGFPGTSTLIAKWYPNQERSRFTAYIYSGGMVGTMVSMTVTGYICSSDYFGGWPTAFYLFGVIGLIWTVIWFVVVSEDPNSHPRISDNELLYIRKALPPVLKERLPAPWKDVLISKYFWVILLTNFGSKWCYYTISIQLPTFFNNMLRIQLKNNGVISALPLLGSWLFSVFYGYIVDLRSLRKHISTLTIRRISMVFGSYVPAMGLIALAVLKCDPYVLITLFVISMSLFGAIHCGYFCSYADIAPRFAGTLFGISNTFGGAAGFLSPLATSFFLENFDPEKAWEITFLTAAILTGATSTLYILTITTEIQPWNEPKEKKEKNDSA